MFNPGQIQKSYQTTIPLIRSSNHLVLDNLQKYIGLQDSSNKSKWDEPIQIPPVLYHKFNVALPDSFKQAKQYPKSLLDYIKRAYEKCKDQNQKLIMEKNLRDIVRTFQSDFNQVSWDSYPLPNIQQEIASSRNVIARVQQKLPLPAARSRLNQIRLPSSYNIVEEQKPSKALQIAKKRMQKLEKKLNKQVIQEEQETKKQTFIGFSSAPPPLPQVQVKAPRFKITPPQQATVATMVKPIISPNLIGKIQPPVSLISANVKPLVIAPPILKCEIDLKPIESVKNKNADKQKQRENRQKQKAREKQKLKQKAKVKNSLETKEQSQRLLQKKQANRVSVTKKQLNLLQKLKQKDENINQVARRFQDFHKLKSDNYQINPVQQADDALDFDQVIVGKNQSIEKPYLRITGRPNPDTVRPQPVLKKALNHFLEKYKKDNNYEYLISQLRSIRQDLTVQHIKNEFSVHVYEENLEISLYEKDIPQFKHCQTTLWQLYSQGYYYTEQSRNKFIAHQMITLVMEQKSQEMEFMMTKIPDSTLQNPRIQECLKLKQQLIVGNYTGFFKFFSSQDRFVKCLLDLYVDKMLVKFLIMICRTCGEKVPIKCLSQFVGQYEEKMSEIIETQKGVIQNGFLILKPSHQQFLKSELLLTKKVTVLLG